MRTGAQPLMTWGAGVLALAALGAVGFGLAVLPTTLLALAGAGAVLTGVASGIAGRRQGDALGATGAPGPVDAPGPAGASVSPDSSAATCAVALGVTVALTGAALGQAFLFTGIGLAALGAGGLVRERRAGRRLLQNVSGAEVHPPLARPRRAAEPSQERPG